MPLNFSPIRGSIVALITPMLDDGAVDYAALRRLIDWHIQEGTDCICVVGTTGESPTVTVQEHCEIIRVSVQQAAGRVPIMAGCGANSTKEAIALAEFAKSVGANCQLQVVPYYNRPTQEGLFQHFSAIARAVDLPMVLYNVPGRTVADMAHDTVLRGGHGNVSVTANIAPRLMHELCVAALAGNPRAAMDIQNRLLPLHKGLFVEANPIPVKWAAARMGLCSPAIRLPLTELSEPLRPALDNLLQSTGLI